MREAIAEAKAAAKEGNAPIGAVITIGNRIVARGHNKVFTRYDITAHAEVVAIQKLAKKIGTFELKRYKLFSTFVPCAMCLATILRANIPTVIYGAEAFDAPQFSSGIHQRVNRAVRRIAEDRIRFKGGVLRFECARLLANAKPD